MPRSDILIIVSFVRTFFVVVVVVTLLTRKSPTLRIRSTEREEESFASNKDALKNYASITGREFSLSGVHERNCSAAAVNALLLQKGLRSTFYCVM